MALVAYDCSSGSEDEENEHEEHRSTHAVAATDLLLKDGATESNKKTSVPEKEPKAKATLGGDEVEKEFRMRIPASVKQLKTIDKRSGKVQILAPTFEAVDSDSDDEQNERRRRVAATKSNQTEKRTSALLSILPPAKSREVERRDRNESSGAEELNFLKKKPTPTSKAESGEPDSAAPAVARKSVPFGFVPPQVARRSAAAAAKDAEKQQADEEEDDEQQIGVSGKFFTFADDEIPVRVKPIAPTFSFAGPSRSALPDARAVEQEESEAQEAWQDEREEAAESNASGLGLDDEAMLRLVGKKQLERVGTGVSVFAPTASVDANSYRTPVHELARELTHADERRALASRLHVQTTNSTEKRKHQITWLAAQAKERELELMNSWAEAKFNKRQTQAKYGF